MRAGGLDVGDLRGGERHVFDDAGRDLFRLVERQNRAVRQADVGGSVGQRRQLGAERLMLAVNRQAQFARNVCVDKFAVGDDDWHGGTPLNNAACAAMNECGGRAPEWRRRIRSRRGG